MPSAKRSSQSWRSKKTGTAKHKRYYDTASGKLRLAKDIRNIMNNYFQCQHWITQQDIEDVLFFKRNRPNGFDIISTLEDISNDFEHRSENKVLIFGTSLADASICEDFNQKHWWRNKLPSRTSK